jgi:hypothetical protein
MSYSPQAFTTATTANLGEIKIGSGFTVAGDGTVNNAGVTQLTGAATIKVSGATGPITLTDVGVFSVAAGTGITTNVTTGSVTVTNAGVTAFNGSTGNVLGVGAVNGSTGSVLVVSSITAGTAMNVSATTGSVTIDNLGVQNITAGTNIAVSTSTGSVTVSVPNIGVTAVNGSTGSVLVVSSIAGTSNQVTASASTGAVTLSLPQSINTTNTPQFAGLKLTGIFTATNSLEVYTSPSISANAVTLDFTTGNTFALASNAANITVNYTNIPTTTGQIISTALVITQGATAYIPSAVTINTVSQTIKWQGGSPPTGNANKTDIVSFTFICNGTTTPTVIGSLSTYG